MPKPESESGIAMIVAVMVSTIVLIMSVTAVSLATHNSDASSRDRARTQSVHAAEAGVNRALKLVNDEPSPPCSLAGTLPTAAEGSYSVALTYYPTYPIVAGTELTCPLAANSSPKGVVLVSKGSVGARKVARTMQAQAALTPILGGFNSAIFANGDISLQQSLTVTGNDGDDGDVYANGNITCLNSVTVAGRLVAAGRPGDPSRGSIVMGGTCTVKSDAWAKQFIEIASTSVVQGNALAAGGRVALSRNAGVRVKLDAKAATTVVMLSGSQSARDDKVDGAIREGLSDTELPDPTYQALPPAPFDKDAWERPCIPPNEAGCGYTEASPGAFTDCALAKTYIRNMRTTDPGQTKTYIRITAPCLLEWGGSESITYIPRDLAIITNGKIKIGEVNTFQGETSSSSEALSHDLHLFVPTGTSCGGDNGSIELSQKNKFLALNVGIYTPCRVDIGQQSTMNGQIYGEEVDIGQSANLTYRPVVIPGAGVPVGFDIDVAFIREIRNA